MLHSYTYVRFCRYCQTVFQNNYISLYSYKQYMRVLVVPHPCQHLYYLPFLFSHYSEYVVVSYCGFLTPPVTNEVLYIFM